MTASGARQHRKNTTTVFLLHSRKWVIANVVTMVLAACILLGMVNYISSRHYQRYDWTALKLHTLSEKTVRVLDSLDTKVKVIVFLQPEHPIHGRRIYQAVHDLLKEYRSQSDKITVTFLDPERDIARVKMLAEKYNVEALNMVVFDYQGRNKSISESDIVEFDYRGMQYGRPPRIKAFKGEEAFTSAILNVFQERQVTVCFTRGHGERGIGSIEQQGIAHFNKALKRENFSTEEILLLEREAVPAECDLLVIAGPDARFSPEEVAMVDRYLEGGGRLLVLLDPLVESGLEELLQKRNVKVGDDVVVDPTKKLPFVSAANLYVDSYTDHPIVSGMTGYATLYFLVRSIDALDSESSDYIVEPLAMTSESGWGETDLQETLFEFDGDRDKKGPVSIAVAVRKAEPGPAAGASDLRMVVFGDADFVSNSQIGNVSNRTIVINAINWLIQKEKLISIGPKNPGNLDLYLSAVQVNFFFWTLVVGMPAVVLLAGSVVMWKRRK